MASFMTSPKFAVLIDADNASPSMAGSVLTEIAKYGTTVAKRAYGDWTGTALNQWKIRLLEQSIQPMQQFAYTTGKNSTDSAMIIDAMDLLYSNKFNGFCIVSSDSDFTRLAVRIRESGLVVFGCGERKTPKPFVTACDKFIYVENLVSMTGPAKFGMSVAGPSSARSSVAGLISVGPSIATSVEGLAVNTSSTEQNGEDKAQIDASSKNTQVEGAQMPEPPMHGNSTPEHQLLDSTTIGWLREAVEVSSDDSGWALLEEVNSLMVQWHSDFDPRTYGCSKLSTLLISTSHVELSRRSPGKKGSNAVYVRWLND
ncbi:hypothetical protein FVEN_g5624 [Fusarium venenatum]|uniref:HTH OST-type domain-containing protein n=1 Tax=Fusarium venenatum TaxID=56646 RepID=A0A2L2U0V8_9HYPO|nr:uncharacterized protein FVRRES_04037 [Fusarium venenatum]KAG8356436.1 hypothetical protein FVEN_g5624 [Fusarium venenatum]CEI67525.1 unnamed protein product [Fusarium venenatum]